MDNIAHKIVDAIDGDDVSDYLVKIEIVSIEKEDI